MPIERSFVPIKSSFVQVPNRWARDERLSHKARGILAELMTHTVGWEVSIESIARQGPEGRDAISSGVRELEALGYLVRVMDRTKGRFKNVIYRLADPWAGADVGLSAGGKPASGEPDTKNTMYKNTIYEELNPHRDEDRHATPRQLQMLWDNYAAEFGEPPTEEDVKRWRSMTTIEASREVKATKDSFFHSRFHGTLDKDVPGVSPTYLKAAGVA